MGRCGRENFHTLEHTVNCRPNRKRDWTLPGLGLARGYYSTSPAGGRDIFLIPQNNSSASEKPPHFKLSVHSSGLLAHSNLPKLPFFSLKKQASPWFPCFPTVFLKPVCPGLQLSFIHSQITPSVAAKITGSSTFFFFF